MMIAIYPIEFVVTPKVTYVLTEYTTNRRIFTDGRDWPSDLLPSFTGLFDRKNGSTRAATAAMTWLEVETRGFKGPRTFEGSGMPLHEDQCDCNPRADRPRQVPIPASCAPRLRSTIIRSLGPGRSTVSIGAKRSRCGDFVDCTEKQSACSRRKGILHDPGDGYLMPTKRDQRAPDLRYFNPAPKGPAR